MTFLGLREFVKDRNPVLYEWMTEVARKYIEDIIRKLELDKNSA